MSNENLRIGIVGGGLGGALLATHLGRAGYQVDLFERRSDPTAGNYVGGRSINLAISTRGIAALQEVGLAQEVLASAVPMRGRMIHARDGRTHFQPYDKDPALCINSVGRAALNTTTIAAAKSLPNVRVQFNQRCVDVDLDRPLIRLADSDSGAESDHPADLVIGADGAGSAVRRAMTRLERFTYSQDFLAHGYKELTIPPTDEGSFRMEPNALHIWPRRSFMMIALPNHDGSFTCTLFFPHDGPLSFASLRTPSDARRFFDDQFSDAVPLMPMLLHDFFANPTGAMATIRCAPWVHGDRVALLGDAAHAVVPFYGQGANASFEDCSVLVRCLRTHPGDRERALREYGAERKRNVDALADLALENFLEMRDKTASRWFHLYKRTERTLHRALPGWYTPLYTLISFSCVPYAESVRRARRANRVVAAVTLVLATLVLGAILRFGLNERWVGALGLSAVAMTGLLQLVKSRLARYSDEARRIGVRGVSV
ncbi:MAG: FAD-dependent monooxygenase [Phycisphaerales bacterium]|nr:FAD-dependent monooxygenase [Phycisphaerales bacterium]